MNTYELVPSVSAHHGGGYTSTWLSSHGNGWGCGSANIFEEYGGGSGCSDSMFQGTREDVEIYPRDRGGYCVFKDSNRD